MDEDTIADLKQFIATVVRTTVREELVPFERRLDQLEKRLEKKIDDKGDEILSAIAATMQNHIDYTDKRFDNHEKRIKKLEHKPA
jgi:hypothetical protein